MQDYENAYQPPFDKSKWGLIEVAQLANYMGTIWATWDKDAPSFEEYLGGARFAFDQGSVPGTEATAARSFWAACKSGRSRATGNSSQKTSPAIGCTASATAPSI